MPQVTHQDAQAKSNSLQTPEYYTVGVFDIDGLLRGKRMHPEKFEASLNSGFGFCDVIYGWDINDKIYDNTTLTGWHTGFPDFQVNLDIQSKRSIPYEPTTQLFIGQAQGAMSAICPRSVLSRVVQRGLDLGMQFKAAFEYEFFVFKETPESVREKNYQNLTPLSPGSFGYSLLRSGVKQSFHQSLWDMCEKMRFPLEGLHTETGPGVIEAALKAAPPIEACDRAGLFKTFCKILAQRQDLMATFMARWSLDVPGQSGHIHISAFDLDNKPLFHDKSGFSSMMTHFIAGIQKYMPHMTALFAPTMNSYTRLVPGFWAPTATTWGVENRTTAIRAIPAKPNSTRVEFRASGADANPYLALAAIMSAGLSGIEQKLTPTHPIDGNAYEVQNKEILNLPANLIEACAELKKSSIMRDFLGDAFVDHFIATRQCEINEAMSQVNDWQLARYFESI
jgi:glutamine synthetase